MSAEPTRIHCSIDLESPGRRVGWLEVRHSNNRHAYGFIPVPIACIGDGEGPTALVTAGNHGDEHEGRIIARRLIRELDPERVHGRLIVMPALNYPAVLEDARVSPIDGGNMNRAYPGDAAGLPTFAIAHYVETVLLPMCDAALDLHSGGKASEFLPCAFLVKSGSREFLSAKLDAVKAFGAPDNHRRLRYGGSAFALRRGGPSRRREHRHRAGRRGHGGGRGTGRRRGRTRRWLAHVGMLDSDAAPPVAARTRFLQTRDRRDFVVASMDGLFEPRVKLGAEVAAGDLAGIVHPVDDPEREGAEVRFSAAGSSRAAGSRHGPCAVIFSFMSARSSARPRCWPRPIRPDPGEECR